MYARGVVPLCSTAQTRKRKTERGENEEKSKEGEDTERVIERKGGGSSGVRGGTSALK